MGTEEASAYGKHHYHAFQASHESALITEVLSDRSHRLSAEKEWPSSCFREKQFESVLH